MLPETFLFLSGVGRITDEKIRQHAKNWDEFVKLREIPVISAEKKQEYDSEVEKAMQALAQSDQGFFAQRLPRHERWRFLPHFKEKLVYLDIETTGLIPRHSYVTVVGLRKSDENKTKLFVKGQNLSEDALLS